MGALRPRPLACPSFQTSFCGPSSRTVSPAACINSKVKPSTSCQDDQATNGVFSNRQYTRGVGVGWARFVGPSPTDRLCWSVLYPFETECIILPASVLNAAISIARYGVKHPISEMSNNGRTSCERRIALIRFSPWLTNAFVSQPAPARRIARSDFPKGPGSGSPMYRRKRVPAWA